MFFFYFQNKVDRYLDIQNKNQSFDLHAYSTDQTKLEWKLTHTKQGLLSGNTLSLLEWTQSKP